MTVIADADQYVAQAKPRVDWVDAARGIGILLVVYGHAIRGQVAGGLYPETPAIQLQDSLIYGFHMPLFFLLAGLFVQRGLDKEGRAGFLKGRLWTVVYPYFLWSILQGLISIGFAGAANKPVEWHQIAIIPWKPFAQFWFLYALFLCQLVVVALPNRRALAVFTLMGLAWVVLIQKGVIINTALSYLPFFALGVAAGAEGVTAFLGSRRRSLAIAALCWACFALGFHMMPASDQAGPRLARMLVLGFAGSGGALALARSIAGVPVLAALGRLTMPIFLMHIIAMAATRAIMGRLGLDVGPVTGLAIVTVAGVVGPWIGYLVIQRLGLSAWLGFERLRKRAAA